MEANSIASIAWQSLRQTRCGTQRVAPEPEPPTFRELSQVHATLVAVPEGPLIVQSDKTLLLEVDHPDALACRMAIAPFAELERSPEHVHTYRLTPLGL